MKSAIKISLGFILFIGVVQAKATTNRAAAEIQDQMLAQGSGTFSLFDTYKEDVGGDTPGSFAGAYDITSTNTPAAPTDALIAWDWLRWSLTVQSVSYT